MPDHDLEPPRFAQLALERVLQDWNALKSMIMFGSQENKDPCVFTNSHQCKIWSNVSDPLTYMNFICFSFPSLSASSRIGHLLPEEQVYLNQQSGTIRLDCFTHCLIVKCTADILVSRFSHVLRRFWIIVEQHGLGGTLEDHVLHLPAVGRHISIDHVAHSLLQLQKLPLTGCMQHLWQSSSVSQPSSWKMYSLYLAWFCFLSV